MRIDDAKGHHDREMTSPYLDKPLIPLAVALPRVLLRSVQWGVRYRHRSQRLAACPRPRHHCLVDLTLADPGELTDAAEGLGDADRELRPGV
jgi:hypothetical protein